MLANAARVLAAHGRTDAGTCRGCAAGTHWPCPPHQLAGEVLDRFGTQTVIPPMRSTSVRRHDEGDSPWGRDVPRQP